MKAIELKGIIPPIITPMNEDESINVAELRRQVDRMIEGGVHALFPFGTNGEGYILNAKEKQLVLETVIDQCNGRVPVYAGTGCISTKETIEQSKMAEAAGADVLSIITPSFAAASQEELYAHYKAVAEAVDMPIVLYNIPARTGNALAPATVGRLAQIENIIGAKDSSGNFANILNYINAGNKKENGKFYTLSGNDHLDPFSRRHRRDRRLRQRISPHHGFHLQPLHGRKDRGGQGGQRQHPELPRLLQIRQSQHHRKDRRPPSRLRGRPLPRSLQPGSGGRHQGS